MHSTRLAPPSPAALTRCLATLHALAAAASLASASPFNHQRPNSSTTLSAASGPHPYPAAAHAASFSASPGPQANVTEMQTLYVTHGGGPMPVLGDPGHAHLVKHLQSVRNHVKAPKAILMVTAHWEVRRAGTGYGWAVGTPHPPVIMTGRRPRPEVHADVLPRGTLTWERPLLGLWVWRGRGGGKASIACTLWQQGCSSSSMHLHTPMRATTDVRRAALQCNR